MRAAPVRLTPCRARPRSACNGRACLTDWLEILREQTATGDQMARDVPKMLADPEITQEQVKALFQRAGETGRVRRAADRRA